MRHALDRRLGERYKSPILFPRLIVNLAEPPAFFANVLEVSRPDGDRPALPETFGQWSQTRRGFCRIGKPPRVPIFYFCESAALNEMAVIRRIVRGQDGGRELESIDQQAADVIG